MDEESRREMANMRKLYFWSLGLFITCVIAVGGGMFAILDSANAKQDIVIEKKINTDIMVRYETSNQREHEQLKDNLIRFEDKVDEKFEKLDNKIDKEMSEIKELLRK